MKHLLVGFVLALMISACAVTPDGQIDAARSAYNEARRQPDVEPELIEKAKSALRRASEAKSRAEREHAAYLAKRYAELALLKGQRAGIERELERLELAEAKGRADALAEELAGLRAGGPSGAHFVDSLAEFLRTHPESTFRVEGDFGMVIRVCPDGAQNPCRIID